jgi:S1-C subfamily serine protease
MQAKRNRKKFSNMAGLAIVLTALQSGNGNAQQRSGTVYRGVLEGGIWLELADNSAGTTELAVLDGLAGGVPQTQFIALVRNNDGSSCQAVGGRVTVSPCPRGAGSVEVQLDQTKGRAILHDVGWDGSFAWGSAAASIANVRAQCQMPGLLKAPGIAGSRFASALAEIGRDVASLPEAGSEAADVIDQLRADRLAAYAAIVLSPAEAQRKARLDAAVAGVGGGGAPISLAEATRLRQGFEAEVLRHPLRLRARDDLLRIDRQLADLYDPVSGRAQMQLRYRLRGQTLPAAQSALVDVLASGQPTSVADLLALETVAPDLDNCATALRQPPGFSAQTLVRTALGYRATELAGTIMASVNGAGDAASARSALQQFEANPAVRMALASGGKSASLATARARIGQMSAAEEKARLAGVRAAAAQVAADSVPPTTASGGRFQVERVARSLVEVFNVGKGGGSGFVVAPGVIVTNVHVIENYDKIYVVPDGKDKYKESNQYSARVIAQYPIHDIAILSVENFPGRTLAIFSSEPSRGTEVWTAGYPAISDEIDQGNESIATITRGVVARMTTGYTKQSEGNGETRLVQVDAQFSSGNSGGPLLDNCHRVIGINTLSVRSKSDISVKARYSVSAAILPDLLVQAGIKPSISANSCK